MKSKRNMSIEILLILLAVCFVAIDVVLFFINIKIGRAHV